MTPASPPPSQRTAKPEWAIAFKKRREKVVGSQEELAIRADVSQSLISQIERGVQHPTGVSVERFARLLSALQWTTEQFSEATGIEVSYPAPRYGNGAPIPPVVQHADPLGHIHIPRELEAVLSKYGAALGIPADIDMRRYIPRFESGVGPQTEEDWQDWLMDNRRWLKGS